MLFLSWQLIGSMSLKEVVVLDGVCCVWQSVEERRTVRDGQGNEETTVTRSGGPGSVEGTQDHPRPHLPGKYLALKQQHNMIYGFILLQLCLFFLNPLFIIHR